MKITLNSRGEIVRPSEMLGAYIITGTRRTLAKLVGKSPFDYLQANVEEKHFANSVTFTRVPVSKLKNSNGGFILFRSKNGDIDLCREKLTSFYGKVPRRLYIEVLAE